MYASVKVMKTFGRGMKVKVGIGPIEVGALLGAPSTDLEPVRKI